MPIGRHIREGILRGKEVNKEPKYKEGGKKKLVLTITTSDPSNEPELSKIIFKKIT